MSIKENWKLFQEKLKDAADEYHRDMDEITVMAVSKTRSVEEIREAAVCGLGIFGENRVEEASEKFAHLDPSKHPLYLIGHLQSNKVNRIDSRYSGVHSVDSVKIARRLSRHRENLQEPLDILLQVNTSGEIAKSGFMDYEIFRDSVAEIAELPFIRLRGLMTMAPFTDDEKIVRNCFSGCREWSGVLNSFVQGDIILSMGMSSDYRWAVAEGSTMLRVGSALFGNRK